MATWQEITAYVSATYSVREDRGDTLSILFDTRGGRSQLVFVHRTVSLEGTEFATIASSLGTIGPKVDVASILKEAALFPLGGIVVEGDQLLVRHSVPLAHAQGDEFDGPLYLVIHAADALEKQFFGTDSF